MTKTILITGATDGLGLEAAKALSAQGHRVLLHGRNPSRLAAAADQLAALPGGGPVETCLADFSRLAEVDALGRSLAGRHERLDVVINNAGVLRTADSFSDDGLDMRFAVNTFAPCLLTGRLLPLLGPGARVINLSSAAQAPVDLDALAGRKALADQLKAYAQSKLALSMWSRTMGLSRADEGPVFVAVNPGSLLATKMVKEGFGMAGRDIATGTDILVRAALSSEFAHASGEYFDNDAGRFAPPHPDALAPRKAQAVVRTIEQVLAEKLPPGAHSR